MALDNRRTVISEIIETTISYGKDKPLGRGGGDASVFHDVICYPIDEIVSLLLNNHINKGP